MSLVDTLWVEHNRGNPRPARLCRVIHQGWRSVKMIDVYPVSAGDPVSLVFNRELDGRRYSLIGPAAHYRWLQEGVVTTHVSTRRVYYVDSLTSRGLYLINAVSYFSTRHFDAPAALPLVESWANLGDLRKSYGEEIRAASLEAETYRLKWEEAALSEPEPGAPPKSVWARLKA